MIIMGTSKQIWNIVVHNKKYTIANSWLPLLLLAHVRCYAQFIFNTVIQF